MCNRDGTPTTNDQGLAHDDDIKEHEVELAEAEAAYCKIEFVYVEKHQPSNLIEFFMNCGNSVGFIGSHLLGCAKNDLCFEIISSNAVTKLPLANMKVTFRDLCMGGYDWLKCE